jgi:hypothetical protein
MLNELKIEATEAVAALQDCVHRLLQLHEGGLRTGEVAALLGIESNVPARNSNWLARTILEQLVSQGMASSDKVGNARKFRAAQPFHRADLHRLGPLHFSCLCSVTRANPVPARSCQTLGLT